MPADFPFEPTGNTIRFDAAATTSQGDLGVEAEQLTIWNSGASGVFIRPSKLSNPAAAVLPTVGTPQQGHMIPPGAYCTLSWRGQRYFSAISLSGTNILYLQPGEGA